MPSSPDLRRHRDPMVRAQARCETRLGGFEHAWLSLEPTFQSRRTVRKWEKILERDGTDLAYFRDPYMLEMMERLAQRIARSYRDRRRRRDPSCIFSRVEIQSARDGWNIAQRMLFFHWSRGDLDPLRVVVSLDSETFEYGVGVIPVDWFYDERFLGFLEKFIFRVPLERGLLPSIAHGGAQFHLSASTLLEGGLLADVVASRLNHPELALWTLDWPNPDSRALRATRPRFNAFRRAVAAYRNGGFHPRARGSLTVEAVFREGLPHPARPREGELMTRAGRPKGSAAEVFQTNFAFARFLSRSAQDVHPGYWQAADPNDKGYMPGQIARYSELNLNNVQIAGEFQVKYGSVVDPDRVPPLEAPLDPAMLASYATCEYRAHMGRTGARDYVEATLLDVHHARYLARHPGVRVRDSLLQDQLLSEAAETLRRSGGGRILDELRSEARRTNYEDSHGRILSDWVEPEDLLWAAWKQLGPRERAAIAAEIVEGFAEYVEQAAWADPRPWARRGDPLEPHRHRVHPLVWQALEQGGRIGGQARRELQAWRSARDHYLARRPVFSPADAPRPWR